MAKRDLFFRFLYRGILLLIAVLLCFGRLSGGEAVIHGHTKYHQLADPPSVSISASPTNICLGASSQITSIITGGTITTYSWNPTSGLNDPSIANPVATPTATTTYTLTVTDSENQTGTGTITITVNPLPTVSIAGSNQVCSASAITLTANANTSSGTITSYQWQLNGTNISGATSNTYSANQAGNYTVTVSNSHGCSTTSAQHTLTVNPLPTVNIAGAIQVCSGSAITLTANANTSSGTITSYQWQLNGTNISGATSNTYSANQSGNYTVTVTNSHGCSTTSAQHTLTVNPLPTVNIAGANQVCSGSAITLTANANTSSGTITSYQWQLNGANISGATSNTYSANQAGNYTVTVTNSHGCSTTSAQHAVTVNPLPTATISGNATVCAGTTNPVITFTGAGGTAPYTFTYKVNGGANQTITTTSGNSVTLPQSTASAGTFTYTLVSVKDASSTACEQNQSGTATITVTPPITASAAITDDIDCAGGTANIRIIASGGTAPYTYTIQGISSNSNGIFGGIPGSTAGITYTWNVTDTGGCVAATGTIMVTEPQALTATAAVTSPITCNGETGTVRITASGGTGPLTYTLNGQNSTTGIFSNVTSGTYNWSVRDANNCGPVSGNIQVDQPSPITVSGATVTVPITCNGGTGEVRIQASGGTGTLKYTFNGQTNTTGIFTGVYAGNGLSYSVTDDNGCGPVTGSLNITQPPAISGASAAITTAILCNGGTATVTITASGGTPPLSYTFNGVTQATNVFTGVLPRNNLPWSVTDAGNCGPASGTISVTQPAVLGAAVSETTPIACYGGTATIRITASGGTGTKTFSFQGQTDNTTGTFSGITAGTYSWQVTDDNGCTVSGNYTVGQPDQIVISSIGSNTAICQGQTLTLNSQATGGTGTLRYNWTGPNGFSSNSPNPSIVNATPAASGTYNLTVTDANNCTATATTSVTVHATPVVTATPANQQVCHNSSSVAVIFTGASGYTWTNNNPGIGLDPSGTGDIPPFIGINEGIAPVTATITVIPEGNGCTGTPVTVTITVNPIPEVTVTNNSPLLCNNGQTNIVMQSNIPGTNYTWTARRINGSTTGFSNGNGSVIQNNLTGAGLVEYVITPTANGCTADDITVTVQVISTSFDLDVNILSGGIPSTACAGQVVSIAFDGNEESYQETEWETRFEWTSSNPNVGLSSSTGTTSGNYGTFTFTTQNLTDEDQTSTITIIPIPYSRSRSCLWIFCSGWSVWQRGPCSGDAISFTITVHPFRASCPDNYVLTTNAGACTATFTPDAPTFECPPNRLTWTMSGATTANSPGTGINTVPQTGFNTGVTTITYQATDSQNKTASCSFTVTVADEESPAISCPADISKPMDPGTCGAVVTWTDPTVTDNCAGNVMLVRTDGTGLDSGDTFPAGTTTISYLATDAAGNTATCSFEIVVAPDTQPPVWNCIGNQAICAPAGSPYNMVGTAWDPTVTDNCPGIITKSYTLTGATSGTGTSLDNVGFGVGTTVVTWLATDANGNSSSCVFEVVVTQSPAVTTDPVSQTVCLNGSVTLTSVASGTPAPTYQWYKDGDAIPGATNPTLTISGIQSSDAGSYAVEVQNDCGAAISAPADITVTTPPVFTTQPASQTDCPGESVEFSVVMAGGVAPYTYQWETRPTSGDPWSPVGTNIPALAITDIGETGPASGTEYRVTVTDDCNNSTTSSIAVLTVNRIVAAPLVETTLCQGENTTFSVNTSGTTPVSYQWQRDGVNINNTGAYAGTTTPTLTINNAQVTENGDYSVIVTFGITQPNNNGAGVTTCQVSALVGRLTIDEGPDIVATPPTQTVCPGETFSIALSNANATPGTTYTWTRNNTTVLTGMDPSGLGETISGALSSQTPGIEQTVTFTITATANGCVSTGTVTVTVVDNQAPTVTPGTCPADIQVNADADKCGAVVNYTPPTFDDGCDGNGKTGTLVSGLAPGSTFPIGTTTVTWEYTDAAGNGPATCSFDVTVTDNVQPSAVCQDITVQLNASGTLSITASDIDNGSSDNCGTVTLSIDKQDFGCADVGTNTVILTVTDASGNTNTCEATVTVEDKIAPVALCKNIIVQLDASGSVSITPEDVDNGSSDNCGAVTLSLDKQDFDCDDAGTNTVILTVTDQNGNTSTCTATITVEDKILPTVVCKDITVQLDSDGQATITASDIDNGSSDNCGIDSRVLSQTVFDCSHAGTNTVTLTITDINGNTASCTATVTIEDDVAPTALCKNITIQLNADGTASITPADIDNGSSDNCGTPSLSLSKTDFNCTELGDHTVTLTVTDGYGNSATCTAIVTLKDDNHPVPIVATVNHTPIDCFGETSTVTITVTSGGVGTLTYWLDGNSNTTGVFSDVPAGSHSWSVTNPLGCGNTTGTVNITQPEQLTATIANTDVTCSSGSDGSITISSASGGTGSYEYSINGGINWQLNPSFTGLVPNIYHVMIRDGNGCEVTLNPALEIYILTAVVSITPVSCFGETDGKIEILNPAGGSGSYDYSINGGTSWQSSGTFHNLAPGSYDVRIRDAVQTYCVVNLFNDPVDIIEPSVLNATLTPTDITCFGGSDGTITVSDPTGGFGTWEVSLDGVNWFDVTTTTPYTFTNLNPGSYNVLLRDKDHVTCTENLPTVILDQAEILSAAISTVNITCNGFNDGKITITGADGGSGTYEYSIDGGTTWQSSNLFENLTPGSYDVRFRDGNATTCVITLNPAVEITEPPVPVVNDPGPLDFCDVANTTSIPLTGTPAGVVFDITGGSAVGLANQTGVTAIPSFTTIAGTATITITPRVGICTGTPIEVDITVAPLPTVTAPVGLTYCEGVVSDPFILNGTPANVRYDISGGTAIGLADATDVSEIPSFTPIAGSATLTVTPKALNCVGTPVTFTVTVRPAPTVSISGGATICRGAAAPNATITNPLNAVIKVIYNINGAGNFTVNVPASSTVPIAVPTSNAGTFVYELVSAQYITDPDCTHPITGDVEFTILEPVTPTITGPNVLCAGTTGQVYTTEPGMTNYQWSISAGGTITAGGTASDNSITVTWETSGTKNVGVRYTDTNGCSVSNPTTYPVTVNALPVITITGPATVCANTAARVYTTQAGMTNYVWTVSAGGTITAGGGSTDNTVTVLWHTGGEQSVSVNYSNSNGCSAGSPRTNTITVHPEPVITLTGDQEACEGSSVHVYTTEPGMSNYIWVISPGGSIQSGGTVNDHTATVKWNTAGPQTISVNYANANGCAAQTPELLNVTVHPKSSPTITGPASICAGSGEYTYTSESGMDNYAWLVSPGGTITAGGSATDNFVTIRWDVSGNQTVSVNYENSLGCPGINPAVRDITVRTASVPTITGVSETCQGTSRTYSTQSGMTNYIWTVSAGTITAGGTTTSNTVTILWDTDGPQSVDVHYTDGTGCTSSTASHPVTVYTNEPPTLTGDLIVCSGSAANRYETETGMSNYAWLVSTGGTITAGGTATDNFVEITWGAAGNRTISVSYTTPDLCTPATPTVLNITVNDRPAVTCPTDITVCINEPPFALAGALPAGGVYSGTGVASSTFNPSVAGLGDHTITYTYSDANSCSNNCTFTITVDPVPAVPDQNITICSGSLFEIDLNSLVPGATFTWTASVTSGAAITGFTNCPTGCGTTISDLLGNPTYTNLSGAGGQTGIVRYVVTANDNNCTGTFNINVTVRPTITPRNISWNSNFDQNTYEVCVGGSVLNDNDLDIIPEPTNYQYDGRNPEWQYAVSPDGPWLPAPGQWIANYRTSGHYQWIVASELMSQIGTYYFRFSITDNNGCISSSDIVDVRIISTMEVDAGEPDYVCTSPTPSAIPLTGASVGGVMAGGTPQAQWQITSLNPPHGSNGTLSSTSLSTDPSSVTYRPPANYVGEVTLTLRTNDPTGECDPLTDTRTIFVLPDGSFDNCLEQDSWEITHTNSDGSFSVDCGLRLTGSDNGSGTNGSTQVTNCVGAGTMSFNWIFTAPENRLVWHTGDQKSGGRYNSSSIRVDRPNNLEVGDLIIVTLHFTSNPGTINRPTGFTQILHTTNTYDDDASVASFYKIATAADVSAAYYTFTANTVGSSTRYLSTRVTGFDESSPIGATTSNTANGPPVVNDYRTITLNSINGNTNSLLVAALSVGGSLDYPLSPSNMNTVFYNDAQTAARVAIQEVSGASGNKSFTWPRYGTVNSSNYAAVAHMFFINPAQPDVDASFYLVNGSPVAISSTNGTTGTVSVPVASGDEIGFRVTTSKNSGGPGELIIFNLQLPNDIPELTGKTTIDIEGCQPDGYEPAFEAPLVFDECDEPDLKTGYPQTSAPVETGCERSQSRTWIYVDNCGAESEPFTQTVTWTEISPITVTCPAPVELPACTAQSDILTAYNAWKAGFTHTGGCGTVTTNMAAFPVLPDMSCGGSLEFTLTVTDECGQEYTCSSEFTVLTANDLVVDCPADPMLPACSTSEEIEAAYNAWKAGFGFSGGCAGVTTNIDELPDLPDLTCGGQVMFTYRADYSTTGCEFAVDCIATFTVEEAQPVTIAIAPDVSLPACATTDEIETAYNTWKAGFTATGGCNMTTNIAEIPALPEGINCGGQISFTFEADNGTGGCSDHAEGTSTFAVIAPPPLVVTCPTDPVLPGCSDPVTVANAYNAWVDGFKVSGGCDVVTNISEIPPLGDMLCEGTLEFTFIVSNGSDVCPETISCTSTFTIGDAPELAVTCPAPELVHGCTTEEIQTAFDAWIGGFSFTGGCNATATDLSFFTPPATCGGILTIAYEVIDECGNSETCVSTFTVEPLALAVIVPADAFEPACQTQDEIDLAFDLWIDQFDYMGGCGVTTTDMSQFNAPNACGGTIIVNYSATDICGQVQVNSAIFTIDFPSNVSQEPTFTVPANITIYTDADCTYDADPAVTGTPTNLDDNCGEVNLVPTYSDDITPGTCPGTFVINRTWTVTDDCLSETSKVQVITVMDNTPPVFTLCPENTGNLPADENECFTTNYTLQAPTATDNCDNDVTISWAKTGSTAGNGTGPVTGPFNVGVTTITYTATDDCGNTATCTQTVTIVDVTPPNLTIGCQDVAEEAYSGYCNKIPLTMEDPTYSDDCWPQEDLTLTWVMTGATEGTGTGSAAGETYNVGVTTVTYTVTDPDGNEASCTFTVTILDTTDPVITVGCQNVSDIAGPNNCFIIPAEIEDPVYSDNCWPTEDLTLTWEMTGATVGSGTGSAAGENYNVGVTTVTYTVSDPDGNEATCTFTVTILRDEVPVTAYECPVPTHTAEVDPVSCSADLTLDAMVVTDPCNEIVDYWNDSPYRTSLTDASGTYPSGTTTFHWYITDISGNEASCQVTVTVDDDIAPTITCPADISEFADDGENFASNLSPADPVLGDNCDIALLEVAWTLVPSTGFESQYSPPGLAGTGFYPTPANFYLGITTITYTVTDLNGNTATCDFTVTILAPPLIKCPPDLNLNADEGECDATVDPGVPTLVSGAQPIDWTWTITNPDGTISNGGSSTTKLSPVPSPIVAAPPHAYDFQRGLTTIVWIATNDAGTSTCTQEIMVNDTQMPEFTTPDPPEVCVENLITASYNGPDLSITPDPDHYLSKAGSTLLDLTGLTDNCECEESDELLIEWEITFDDETPYGYGGTTQTGTGQPSDIDLYLWGDGINYTTLIHTIRYIVIDCNGVSSSPAEVNITVKPRPQIIKN
ncbi:protein containing PKD repeat [Bacteroidales bacterium 6E]|nr:protein containing PKD repeat [Bacteroidales bacterium 6E]